MSPAGSGRSAAGLPFPTGTDPLYRVPDYIADLADAAAVLLASPGLVFAAQTLGFDGTGQAWATFLTLSTVRGVVAQGLSGGVSQPHMWVIGLAGNAALLRATTVPFDAQASAVSPFVGQLALSLYAWGDPA